MFVSVSTSESVSFNNSSVWQAFKQQRHNHQQTGNLCWQMKNNGVMVAICMYWQVTMIHMVTNIWFGMWYRRWFAWFGNRFRRWWFENLINQDNAAVQDESKDNNSNENNSNANANNSEDKADPEAKAKAKANIPHVLNENHCRREQLFQFFLRLHLLGVTKIPQPYSQETHQKRHPCIPASKIIYK